jgi:hypothetical protein
LPIINRQLTGHTALLHIEGINRRGINFTNSSTGRLRIAAKNFFYALDEFLVSAETEKPVPQPSQSSRLSEGRLLDVKAAAAYMGRTLRAVCHMIDKGILPATRIDSRLMLDRVKLDQLIEDQ